MKRYRAEITFELTERLLPNTEIANKLGELGFSDVTVEGAGRNYIIEATWDLHDAKISLKEIPITIDRSKSEYPLAALLLGIGEAEELQPPKEIARKRSTGSRNKRRKGRKS
jgi:hypothetical protein